MVIKDSNICVFFIFALNLYRCILNATQPQQNRHNAPVCLYIHVKR